MEGKPAIVLTPFDQGLATIREVLGKYANPIMMRKTLMRHTPALASGDWRTWAQRLNNVLGAGMVPANNDILKKCLFTNLMLFLMSGL